jgi:hypothetical protein
MSVIIELETISEGYFSSLGGGLKQIDQMIFSLNKNKIDNT